MLRGGAALATYTGQYSMSRGDLAPKPGDVFASEWLSERQHFEAQSKAQLRELTERVAYLEQALF